MAAPIASGTAFHLCPGDARSALVISALGADDHSHHHHHPESGGIEKTTAEPGCSFAGVGSAIAFGLTLFAPDDPQSQQPTVAATTSFRHTSAWARPPVRSPPA